jgi:hypothetical protein
MSEPERQQPNATKEGQEPPAEPVSRYEVVPYKDTASDADLYSFRSAMPQFLPSRTPGQAKAAALAAQAAQAAAPATAATVAPAAAQPGMPAESAAQAPAQPIAQPDSQPDAAVVFAPAAEAPAVKPPLDQKKLILYAGVGGVGVVLMVLLLYMAINKQNPIQPYVDLGQTNIASAGLAGRLVAKWEGSASYELHIDPLSPQQAAGFAAVAVNPPHPLTIDLRIANDNGSVVCRKEIVIPFNPVQDPDDAVAQELQPQKTFDGDTVQNVAGPDGQLEEILMTGPLTCPEKAYRAFSNWQFTSSFPSVADQQDWLRQQDALVEDLRRKAAVAKANASMPRGLRLAAPVDGADVITSDNPSHGTVATRGGRSFYVGKNGEMARAGWFVFPATIHFHCDVKSNCVLSRPDVSTSLSARLLH